MFTGADAEVTYMKFKQRNLDQSYSKTRLYSQKCKIEVCKAHASHAHGVEVVVRLETLDLEQTSHWPIHSSFEWSRFAAGKLLQTHWLTMTTWPDFK
jgi:hypothetical protein